MLRTLYAWHGERRDDPTRQGTFNSASVADVLSWQPERLNRAVKFLEGRGLIEVDQRLGTAPFDTWGFELNAEGLVECERLGLDGASSRPDASQGPVIGPSTRDVAKPDPTNALDEPGTNLGQYVPEALRSRFVAVHELGAGSYATVYLVQDRESLESRPQGPVPES